MEKKKLVLKKQVIAELSEREKRNILGGNDTGSGPPGATEYDSCIDCPTALNICMLTEDLPCPNTLQC